ncbi:hypothetical protein [Streptomyces sp. 2A115]|uniref:hypothetical protein n=1 Tax=Streptomyces sp. 2A115 TaxID=3457439 RepID=UPI003FD07F47
MVEVVGRDTDPSARRLVERVLRDAGARTVRTVTAGERVPAAALTVYVGGPSENAATAKVLSRLGPAVPLLPVPRSASWSASPRNLHQSIAKPLRIA